MPKVTSEKQINSFIKGFVTEVSPLTFPENASLDEDNFVLNRDGSRSRRLGIEYESGYSMTDTGLAVETIEETRYSFHQWQFPSGDTTKSIGVVRVFNKLWFMNMLKTNPSANLLNGGSSITITGLANSNLETTLINNNLVIVSSDLPYPILLTYNTTTDVVSQTQLVVQVRDLWGVNDSLAIDFRPSTLSNLHKYNLRNQGWSTKIVNDDASFTDALEYNKYLTGKYPSNADIWSLGQSGDVTSEDFETYVPALMIRNNIDNSYVGRGSYIIDLFNRGTSRETLSTITGLPLDKDNGRFSTVTSYAGRVFYSGVASQIVSGDNNSPNYSGYIFFSQLATSKEKLSKCYQEADPTSPKISDIVDTDGGTIQIPEASKIIKIVNAKSSLIVFAENGVWEVYGDTGGFVATSYQLSKISSVGISNQNAVVDAHGSILYWSKAGIYVLSQEPTSGRYSTQSISLSSIQSFYNDLPDAAKENSKGFFDENQNRVRWCYNDTEDYSATSYVNRYNRELILDLTLQAFYLHSIDIEGKPFIAHYVPIPGYTSASIEETVYVGTQVVTSGGVNVFINSTVPVNRTSQFSFLTLLGSQFTLAKYLDDSFLDWVSYDAVGTGYSSYLVTGYQLMGDLMRKKQVPYILFYLERTEDGFTEVEGELEIDHPSSCLVQAQWNWADSANSGKWGSQFQAYRFLRNYIPSGPADTFDYGDRVIVTKNKLRGSGRALSLKIQSESGKDMRLLGWAMMVTGGSAP